MSLCIPVRGKYLPRVYSSFQTSSRFTLVWCAAASPTPHLSFLRETMSVKVRAFMSLWLRFYLTFDLFLFVVVVLSWTVWTPSTIRDCVCSSAARRLSPTTRPTPAWARGKLFIWLHKTAHNLVFNESVVIAFVCQQDRHNGVLWKEWSLSWCVLGTILF